MKGKRLSEDCVIWIGRRTPITSFPKTGELKKGTSLGGEGRSDQFLKECWFTSRSDCESLVIQWEHTAWFAAPFM